MRFFRIEIPAGDGDRAAEVLYRCGSAGGFEAEGRFGPVFFAVFPSIEGARTARELLRARGIDAGPEEPVQDEDWNASYRSRLEPFDIAGFRIEARDEPGGPAPADPAKFLHIPAAGAFGTGFHESTRGILRFLAGDTLGGKNVLDAGCGTGILAIAAARLGAARCVAFDVDPEAAFESRRNLARNPTGGRVAILLGGIECVAGSFDRILANMIWEEVSPLLSSMARLLAPGGLVVLSGILDEREFEAVAGLEASSLMVERKESDGEWRTLTARATAGRGSINEEGEARAD
ncbi:MAG: 50S ribosomal protein L11 methyltransferase [Thermoanaerobaculia bacterium]